MSTNTTKVQAFLKQHHMGILSTVSDKGEPWGAAVIFATDEHLNFYFMTRADTLKYKNLEISPKAALTVADEEKQISVQVSGLVTPVATNDFMDVIFKKLASVKPRGDFQWIPPVIKVHKGDYKILCLTPKSLQYADFKQPKTDVHSEYIEKII